MSKTEDDIVTIGEPMPEILDVQPDERYSIAILWNDGRRQVVDLAPDIFTFKAYAPLRDNAELFKTVHVVNIGSAIAWGPEDTIDMPVSAIERLASEVMSGDDFQSFLALSNMTRDAAAAQLGISRRLVGYYASGRPIPRYISLACAYLSVTKQAKISTHVVSDTHGQVKSGEIAMGSGTFVGQSAGSPGYTTTSIKESKGRKPRAMPLGESYEP